jgi:phosphate transport system permease protein
MTKGGIFPAIIGTFLLSTGAILFALPLGKEVGKNNKNRHQ